MEPLKNILRHSSAYTFLRCFRRGDFGIFFGIFLVFFFFVRKYSLLTLIHGSCCARGDSYLDSKLNCVAWLVVGIYVSKCEYILILYLNATF